MPLPYMEMHCLVPIMILPVPAIPFARDFINLISGIQIRGWEQDAISNVGLDATIFNRSAFHLMFIKNQLKVCCSPSPCLQQPAERYRLISTLATFRIPVLDITAKYSGNISRDLKFNVSATFTTYHNNVKKLPDPGYFDAISQPTAGKPGSQPGRTSCERFFRV